MPSLLTTLPALAALTVLASLVSCSTDEADDRSPGGGGSGTTGAASTPSPAEATGAPAAASCARVSATDLAGWLGVDVATDDDTDDPATVSCSATVSGSSVALVAVQWTVADEPAPPEGLPPTASSRSAEGTADDGRTVTATATRYRTGTDDDDLVDDSALQTAVDNIVDAYATAGPPTLTGDLCGYVSDTDASYWGGYPIEVREAKESRGDVLCSTVAGDENADNALASLEWRLVPPEQTLAAEAGPGGQDVEEVELPGGQPAVTSYEEGLRLAIVAAQAGELTVVVEVQAGGLSTEEEYPGELMRSLARDVAAVYAG